MMRKLSSPRAVLAFGVVMSAFSAIFVRLSGAPSLVLLTFRLGWTVALMLPVAAMRREEFKALSLRAALGCILSGVFLAAHFALWVESLYWTSVATSTVLLSTEVIFSALGFVLFFRGRIARMGVCGIALLVGGSALLALAEQGGAGGSLRGGLLSLGGAVCLSVYTLLGRKLRETLSTTVYTSLVYAACLVTLLLFDLVSATRLAGWGTMAVLMAFLLCVVCTFMGHSIFNWSLKFLSPCMVSSYRLCGPVFSALLAFLFFGERLQPLQLLGGLLILLGSQVYTRSEEKINACNLEQIPV